MTIQEMTEFVHFRQILVFPDGYGGTYFSTLDHVVFMAANGRTTLVAWRKL